MLESPHLSPALLLVVGPWAWLFVQQRADQGRGLLGVGAQVGRQDHVGGHGSSLRVDGQLWKVRATSQGACLGMRSIKKKKKVIPLGPAFYLQSHLFKSLESWLLNGKLHGLHYFLLLFFSLSGSCLNRDSIVWVIQWSLSYVINDMVENSA